MTSGYLLKKLRICSGYGVRELANLLSVSPSYISDLERNYRAFLSPKKLVKFCKIYNLDYKRIYPIVVKLKVKKIFTRIKKSNVN